MYQCESEGGFFKVRDEEVYPDLENALQEDEAAGQSVGPEGTSQDGAAQVAPLRRNLESTAAEELRNRSCVRPQTLISRARMGKSWLG